MVAIFAGSFDPLTRGHVEIVQRGLRIFDKVIVGIGTNVRKQYLLPQNVRHALIQEVFAREDRVIVETFEGLTVDFARSHDSRVLLRGIRSCTDLNYEQPTSLINRHLDGQIETVYLHAHPETMHISSTMVREVIRYQQKIDGLVPPAVAQYIQDNLYN